MVLHKQVHGVTQALRIYLEPCLLLILKPYSIFLTGISWLQYRIISNFVVLLKEGKCAEIMIWEYKYDDIKLDRNYDLGNQT